MFALLAPAGFALIVGVKQRLDAHAQFQAAQRREKAAKGLRGAAAGALPEAADVAEWRAKAALATQRIVGLEGILQDVTAQLRTEAQKREEAEAVAGEALFARDEAVAAAASAAAVLEEENAALAGAVDAQAEAARAAAAAARAATRDAAAASASAAAAHTALATVAERVLSWRDTLAVASLEAGPGYGSEPTAASVLAVIGDMDAELEVSVMMEAKLPPALRARLAAKREELANRRSLCAPPPPPSGASLHAQPFEHRAAMDAPERLRRLVEAAAAAAKAAPAAPAPAPAPPPRSPASPAVSDKENGSSPATVTRGAALVLGLAGANLAAAPPAGGARKGAGAQRAAPEAGGDAAAAEAVARKTFAPRCSDPLSSALRHARRSNGWTAATSAAVAPVVPLVPQVPPPPAAEASCASSSECASDDDCEITLFRAPAADPFGCDADEAALIQNMVARASAAEVSIQHAALLFAPGFTSEAFPLLLPGEMPGGPTAALPAAAAGARPQPRAGAGVAAEKAADKAEKPPRRTPRTSASSAASSSASRAAAKHRPAVVAGGRGGGGRGGGAAAAPTHAHAAAPAPDSRRSAMAALAASFEPQPQAARALSGVR